MHSNITITEVIRFEQKYLKKYFEKSGDLRGLRESGILPEKRGKVGSPDNRQCVPQLKRQTGLFVSVTYLASRPWLN